VRQNQNTAVIMSESADTTEPASAPSSADSTTIPEEEIIIMDDSTLLQQADKHIRDERLIIAARLLRLVNDTSQFTDQHLWVLQKAGRGEQVVREGLAKPDLNEWKVQGESHDGTYDTIIYYKIVDSLLTARIETPIQKSLMVPLLSVFNETQLYTTFLPRFERPVKLGVDQCDKLRQQGRCNQLLIATTDLPWPIAKRECLIEVVAMDDIDGSGAIVVKMETGDPDDADAPPVGKSAVRIDFEGGIIFRKCPKDHASFEHSKKETNDHDHEDMILVCMTIFVDPKMKYIPSSMINFVTRTVLGRMWHEMLHVAEDVRDGKRQAHADAIAEKKEFLYDWVERRAQIMLSGM
jgi:hypothetical protein